MRNENVSKENISTKQILQERESVKNISKENRIEFSGKLQKSVLEVQRKYGDILGFPHHGRQRLSDAAFGFHRIYRPQKGRVVQTQTLPDRFGDRHRPALSG